MLKFFFRRNKILIKIGLDFWVPTGHLSPCLGHGAARRPLGPKAGQFQAPVETSLTSLGEPVRQNISILRIGSLNEPGFSFRKGTTWRISRLLTTNFAGKKVLVRVDFNAPVDADGNVTDDTRIRAALPTINKLVGDGARSDPSRATAADRRGGLRGSPSAWAPSRAVCRSCSAATSCSRELVGPAARGAVDALEDGDVLLLENIRFDKREKKNDPEFARALADLADAYVNDAFGTAHRAHASTAGVAAYLPSYAGYLMEREVAHAHGHARRAAPPLRRHSRRLEGLRQDQGHRRAAGEGRHPHHRRRHVLHVPGGPGQIRGHLAHGRPDWVERAGDMMKKAADRGVSLLLPVDVVCADAFANDANLATVSVDEIPRRHDGPRYRPGDGRAVRRGHRHGQERLLERPHGRLRDALLRGRHPGGGRAVAANEADTIIGGGDSVAAVNQFDLADKMTFISTGGGASMELVQGEALPRRRGPSLEKEAICPRKNLIAGNWKMNNTVPEAVVLAQEISNRMERDWLELVDVAVCPPFVDLKPVKSVFEFDRVDIAVRCPERLLGAQGRVYRRDFHRHDQEHRLRLLHRGPFRAPQPLRRDQRGSERRPARSSRPISPPSSAWVSRCPCATGHLPRFRHGPGARGLCRYGRGRRGEDRCGLRAGVGYRHGTDGHAGAGRGGLRRHPRHRVGHVRC